MSSRYFVGATSAEVYREQVSELVHTPDYVVTVRDRPTREILNAVTEIMHPQVRCQMVPGRKLNPWLALSESLWMLAGRHDIAALLPYNKRITEFSDDGVTMYGAYGARMAPQIPAMIRRLQEKPEDRRAVLQIWNSSDLVADTKDPPCNDIVMFKMRQDRLFMLVACRSNDLHWGLHAVNLPQFSILQEYIASRLGVEMGTQTHMSHSLHVYTDKQGQRITDRMMKAIGEPLEWPPPDWPLFPLPWPKDVTHMMFVGWCSDVLDGVFTEGTEKKLRVEFPFLEFAEDFLRLYRLKKPTLIRHCNRYDGWMQMGLEFDKELMLA